MGEAAMGCNEFEDSAARYVARLLAEAREAEARAREMFEDARRAAERVAQMRAAVEDW